MQIIPALDLRNSKCVRLIQGEYARETMYSDNPIEIVERFWDEGARTLHVVDLEGARTGRFSEQALVGRILERRPFAIQLGGGIRTLEQACELIEQGVQSLVLGTIAIRSSAIVADWIKALGPERFCIGLDLKQGALSTEGWTTRSEVSLEALVPFYRELGVRRFLCTDVSVDGTLAGPSLALYQTLTRQFPWAEWIASGGVSSIDDLSKLSETNVSGVVVGKALYEGRFTFAQAQEALSCSALA